MLGDAQARGEYPGGFRVCVGEDGHSLHIEGLESDEERGGRTPPPEGGERGHVVVVVPPSAGSS